MNVFGNFFVNAVRDWAKRGRAFWRTNLSVSQTLDCKEICIGQNSTRIEPAKKKNRVLLLIRNQLLFIEYKDKT